LNLDRDAGRKDNKPGRVLYQYVTNPRSPSLSIVIPVLHELATINAFLTSLKQRLADDSIEIIVVDGSPDRETADRIDDPAIIVSATNAGRGHQMNVGARQAQGEILLFLHADTLPPFNTAALIQRALIDPRLVGGAFRLAVNTKNPVLWFIARMTTLRSRFTRLPFGDQGIFIRRAVFEQLGGYRDIPIMEDLDLMRRLRYAGFPIAISPAVVLTSSRRWDNEGIVFGTLRNWLLRTLYYLGVSPVLLAAWYY
jgi:rSAM/selenodomain-associated transferase 2